jgi:copper chaperone
MAFPLHPDAPCTTLFVGDEYNNLNAYYRVVLIQPLERGITMQTELMKVTGMTCGGCISNVTHALKTIDGVGDVKVSLSAGEATVQYDERLTSPDQLKSAVKGAGYGVDLTDATPSQKSKGGCCG